LDIGKAKLIDGWIPEIELEWLAEQASKSSCILELGSFLGRSTRAICDNTNGWVYSVDMWEQEGNKLEADFVAAFKQYQQNLKDHIDSGFLKVYKNTTDIAIERFLNSKIRFDFIFIDADHTYEQVRKDIIGCKKLLAPNGVLSGHDFNWEGVERAVRELAPNYKLHNYIWYTK